MLLFCFFAANLGALCPHVRTISERGLFMQHYLIITNVVACKITNRSVTFNCLCTDV